MIFLTTFPFFAGHEHGGSPCCARSPRGEARLEPAVLGLGQAASHGLHQGRGMSFGADLKHQLRRLHVYIYIYTHIYIYIYTYDM